MGRRWIVTVTSFLLLLTACTSRQGPGAQPTSSPTGSPTAPPTSSPSPAAEPRLASGADIPDGCEAAAPRVEDTATFVALGRAWALSVDGRRLTCLFEVGDPGPFEWGPLGDRALVAGLEVKGLPGAPVRPAEGIDPSVLSWGRPTGRSVVFVAPGGSALEKMHLERTTLEDVTPLRAAAFVNVTYHPSGLALGFAIRRGQRESLWLSSNTGEEPSRMVFTEVGTTFGAMAFSQDGRTLLYAALHTDDHTDLHQIDLTDTSQAPVLWASLPGGRILDILPGDAPEVVAFTTGSGCEDSAAMVRTGSEPGGRFLLPGETRPTRAVGWLDGTRMMVATGGCDEPLDLTSVDLAAGEIVPLAFGVDAASVRTPAPTPPPPLPDEVDTGGGFA